MLFMYEASKLMIGAASRGSPVPSATSRQHGGLVFSLPGDEKVQALPQGMVPHRRYLEESLALVTPILLGGAIFGLRREEVGLGLLLRCKISGSSGKVSFFSRWARKSSTDNFELPGLLRHCRSLLIRQRLPPDSATSLRPAREGLNPLVP